MQTSETVLCCARADLPPGWLPADSATAADESAVFAGLAPIRAHWIPRPDAENDPAYKQIIPYVLLEDGRGFLAAYPRRGGESRLHGRLSVGIGGHINPCDAPSTRVDGVRFWSHVLRHGLARELAEEFPAAVHGTTTLLGLVNEDISPVGRVHLAVVFHHRVPDTPVPSSGELTGLTWIPRASFGTAHAPLDRFERWSQSALRLLDGTSPSHPGVCNTPHFAQRASSDACDVT